MAIVPDLLSHVLFAYALVTLLGLRWKWLEGGYVTLGMAGALVPDLSKAYLVIDEDAVEAALAAPFEWYGLHTLGGVLVVTALVSLWVEQGVRRRAFAVCAFGGGTHLLLDSFIAEPTGYSYAALWPLTYHRVPSIGLYISTDIWPLGVAVGVALLAFAVGRRRC